MSVQDLRQVGHYIDWDKLHDEYLDAVYTLGDQPEQDSSSSSSSRQQPGKKGQEWWCKQEEEKASYQTTTHRFLQPTTQTTTTTTRMGFERNRNGSSSTIGNECRERTPTHARRTLTTPRVLRHESCQQQW